MEPLKEQTISTLNVVKENYVEKVDDTKELSSTVKMSVLGQMDLQQEKMTKRRLDTLYESLNHWCSKKDFWFLMDDENNIFLSLGENQMVIRTDKWEKPKFECSQKYQESINGFELYCHPVDGPKGSDTEKVCKKFMKIWSGVKSTMREKKFWKEVFRMFWEDENVPLF